MIHLPNILTTFRFVFALLFIYFITMNTFATTVLAFIFFIVASITDYYDGYFARKYNLISNFGKIMDPIADKFLVLSAFIIFMQMFIIPLWMVVLIVIREVYVTIARLIAMSQGRVIAAERSGKIKTVLQITSILLIMVFLMLQESVFTAGWMDRNQMIFYWSIQLMMLATVFMTFKSGWEYIQNSRRLNT